MKKIAEMCGRIKAKRVFSELWSDDLSSKCRGVAHATPLPLNKLGDYFLECGGKTPPFFMARRVAPCKAVTCHRTPKQFAQGSISIFMPEWAGVWIMYELCPQ